MDQQDKERIRQEIYKYGSSLYSAYVAMFELAKMMDELIKIDKVAPHKDELIKIRDNLYSMHQSAYSKGNNF